MIKKKKEKKDVVNRKARKQKKTPTWCLILRESFGFEKLKGHNFIEDENVTHIDSSKIS